MGGHSGYWEIIEPQPCPIEGCTAIYRRGLFPDALKDDEKYDIILHTHCMEHMEDPKTFFEGILRHISQSGRMIFSVPDMKKMLEKEMTSIINFEHTMLLTEEYIDYLLGKYGFRIDKKLGYGNGHSLIYTTTYTGERNCTDLEGMYERNKILMMNFYEKHANQVKVWNEQLRDDSRECYLFGAHITSQFFAVFGLNVDRIMAILDNDPAKIGGRVCGINKRVYSPVILEERGNVIVILPKTPYMEEIKKGIANINTEVEFWIMG